MQAHILELCFLDPLGDPIGCSMFADNVNTSQLTFSAHHPDAQTGKGVRTETVVSQGQT
jgi:hypothetical protein